MTANFNKVVKEKIKAKQLNDILAMVGFRATTDSFLSTGQVILEIV